MIIHLHVIISTNKVIRRKLQECKPECSIISPNEIYQYNNIIHKGLTKPHKIFSKIEFVRVTFINCPQKEEAASCIRYTVEWKRYTVIIYRPVHRIEVNKLSIITFILQMFCTFCQRYKL